VLSCKRPPPAKALDFLRGIYGNAGMVRPILRQWISLAGEFAGPGTTT
jgi:hypothetical protein